MYKVGETGARSYFSRSNQLSGFTVNDNEAGYHWSGEIGLALAKYRPSKDYSLYFRRISEYIGQTAFLYTILDRVAFLGPSSDPRGIPLVSWQSHALFSDYILSTHDNFTTFSGAVFVGVDATGKWWVYELDWLAAMAYRDEGRVEGRVIQFGRLRPTSGACTIMSLNALRIIGGI